MSNLLTEESPGDYPETADIESSTDQYAHRFAGPTGTWMLAVQERITAGLIRDTGARSILDVGGGHGQLAAPLCRDGYEVTVLSSAETCRKRIANLVDEGVCDFRVGNVIDLPFEDNAFDIAVSFRMVTHCGNWPELIAELCRVARLGVIVDYPVSQSLNAIAPALFGAKKKLEKDTRSWRLFKHSEIESAFIRAGYCIEQRHGQFFLPMVLHRILKRPAISSALESACRAVGLTGRWGSPVIARATQRALDR